MTNSLSRTIGSALSITAVAVLGVGALSPATAAAAGVDTQQLRAVQTSPMRAEVLGTPTALPVGEREQLRYRVAADGAINRLV